MATTAITLTTLSINTVSADILDAGGTVATTPADGWVIAALVNAGGRVLLKFLVDGTGDTITLLAGDRPPSQRVDLGNLSLVLAANDVRYICVEASRFLQDDGTIHATCTDAGTSCLAFLLPAE